LRLKRLAILILTTLFVSGAAHAQTSAGAAAAPGGPVVFATDDKLQTCITARPDKDGGLDELYFGSCASPAALFVFDDKQNRIRSAKAPKFCMSDVTGAGDAPFASVMRECSDDSFGQFYTYDRRVRRIVSVDSRKPNRPDPDGFCYFARGRGARAQIMNTTCKDKPASVSLNTFVMAPRPAP